MAEIVDVSDDIDDAIQEGDFLLAEGLTNFYAELCCDRDRLRARIVELHS